MNPNGVIDIMINDLKLKLKIWWRGYTDEDMIEALFISLNGDQGERQIISRLTKGEYKALFGDPFQKVLRALNDYENGSEKIHMLTLHEMLLFASVRERLEEAEKNRHEANCRRGQELAMKFMAPSMKKHGLS